MSLAHALERLHQSRQALLKLIQPLSEAELKGPPVEGIWTIHDVLGHIAAWEKALLEPLQVLVQGGEFTPQVIADHDAWNAVQASLRKTWSAAQLLQELHDTRQALIAAAEQLTPEQCGRLFPAPWGGDDTLPAMLDGLAWHEEEHTRAVRAYLSPPR